MKEILKLIRNWSIFGLSAMIVLAIWWYIILKARSSTNPWLGDDGTSLYTNVNETLTAAKRNALVDKSVSCPTGFTSISKNGSMLGCLQTVNGGWKSCPDAIQDCRTNYGGRLPTYSELYIWFKNSLITIWATDKSEWTDDAGYYYQWSAYQVCWVILKTSPFAPTSDGYYSTTHYYRCFIPR